MTSEQGKRGFLICTLVSLVVGVIIALMTYDSLLDVRSLNIIGLVYILVVGLYTLFIAVRAGAQKKDEAAS